MPEIPDDIRAVAVKVYTQYTRDKGSWSLTDLIAEALMAERERAGVAEAAKQADPRHAAAIRRGSST